jgi:hypothetical protein
VISLKPINETKFHEITIWYEEKNFLMSYDQAYKTLCGGQNIFVKFAEEGCLAIRPRLCFYGGHTNNAKGL